MPGSGTRCKDIIMLAWGRTHSLLLLVWGRTHSLLLLVWGRTHSSVRRAQRGLGVVQRFKPPFILGALAAHAPIRRTL
jgi:hypothetical protein